MVNDAVEVTFMDALKCELANVDDNKNQEMYRFLQITIVKVLNGG